MSACGCLIKPRNGKSAYGKSAYYGKISLWKIHLLQENYGKTTLWKIRLLQAYYGKKAIYGKSHIWLFKDYCFKGSPIDFLGLPPIGFLGLPYRKVRIYIEYLFRIKLEFIRVI